MKILIFNTGSGSEKVALYDVSGPPTGIAPPALWTGYVDWSAQPGSAALQVRTATGVTHAETVANGSREQMIERLLDLLLQGPTRAVEQAGEIDVVGHRIVHAGPHHQAHSFITPELEHDLTSYQPLAPDHTPNVLLGLRLTTQRFPGTPQIGAFDSAFHAGMPAAATVYPLPYSWYEYGFKRFGFHGFSHQYAAERTAQILGRDSKDLRLVTCHLGGGCSLAAIQGGHSIDTTMGFTPLEGVMMNIRSGTVDPGLLLYLLRQPGYTLDQLNADLNRHGGLLGIAGLSGDLRQILPAAEHGDGRAQLARDMYVHRLRGGIGAMLAALGGIDALVFTGGVGEHLPEIRRAAVEPFRFVGMQIDDQRNDGSPVDTDIALAGAPVRVVVVHAAEEWMMTRACWELMQQR